MKRSLLFFMGVFSSMLLFSQSQLHVFQDWERTTGSQHFFYKNVTKTDGSGNVYVAGATENGAGNYDILVAKYNSSGVQQWINQIDGTAHYQDFATALQLDNAGNVYITGAITNDTINQLSDLILVKYNSSGAEQWRATYDGAGNYDCGTDILASTGSVLVIGSSYNASGNLDFVSILYNSSGVHQWTSTYDHVGMNDVPVQVQKSGSSIFVSGGVQTGFGTYDWAAVKYNTSGTQLGVKVDSGSASGIEEVHGMAIDANGNIYLAGIVPTFSDGYDYDIIKLDSNLVIQWENTYDGADHFNDITNGIQVNASGDVYVTGYSRTSAGQNDYLTLKYNSGGSLIWAKTFNDSLNGNDEASAIVLDNSGNVYVTGSAKTATSGLDYYTIKYDSSGTEKWNIYFDGDRRLDDKATNIAIDTVGAVVVTGESETATGVYEYATVRYIEKNIIVPTDFSGTPANSNFLYFENKGQLTVYNDTLLIPRVKYYTNHPFPALYIMADTLSMVFSKIDTVASTADTIQRINLTFTGCNEHLNVYPLDKQEMYLNYFLPQCLQGITNIHGNERLLIPNLYDSIDLMYYSDSAGFKYYFIIKAGGDPGDIQMKYTGATSTSLASNILTVNSEIASVSYNPPFTYQLNSSNDTIAGSGIVANWHDNTGSNYDFSLHPFDSTKTLVIVIREDAMSCTPALSFKNIRLSTYYGGTNHDRINGSVVDTSGNVFYSGECLGNTFPVLTTLHPTGGGTGNYNGLISKFAPLGSQTFATYYGGTGGSTWLYGITTNIAGEPTAVGQTSSTNFPLHHTGSQYTQGLASFEDGCIVRLAANGASVKWASYFGGTGSSTDREYLERVVLKGNETYVIGAGTEASPHVTKTGAYNSPTTPSGHKGIIAHFNSSDSLIWSTFIGDDVKGIDYSSIGGNMVIGGEISTSDLPYTAPGMGIYVDSTLTGASDAFFAILNSSDAIQWATYYGGSNADICNAVKWEHSIEAAPVNFYAIGSTTSSNFQTNNSGAVGANYYDTTYNANQDVVFWKFGDHGAPLWATYYGMGSEAAGIDDAIDLAIDKYNNVYFSGSTTNQLENTTVFPTWYTQNYTNTVGSDQSFIFAVSRKTAAFWATDFGGDLGENSTSLSIDGKNDYLYLTGFTTTNSNAQGFPAYRPSTISFPGGWYYCESASPSLDDGFFSQFKIGNAVFVGIDEPSDNNNETLAVYPNPFSDDVTLNFSTANSRDYTIQVFNTLGQVVFFEKGKSMTGSVSKTLQLQVNKGLYYVQVKLSDRLLSTKIIKQ